MIADGPADEAGLRGAGDEKIDFQGRQIEVGGDVIVAVDGEELVGESDLSRLIPSTGPGDDGHGRDHSRRRRRGRST